jgi:hypothetical protein
MKNVILRSPKRTKSNSFSDALFRTYFLGCTFSDAARQTLKKYYLNCPSFGWIKSPTNTTRAYWLMGLEAHSLHTIFCSGSWHFYDADVKHVNTKNWFDNQWFVSSKHNQPCLAANYITTLSIIKIGANFFRRPKNIAYFSPHTLFKNILVSWLSAFRSFTKMCTPSRCTEHTR